MGKTLLNKFASQGYDILACGYPYDEDFIKECGDMAAKYAVNIKAIFFDVTKNEELESGLDKIGEYEGEIDLLVNNAGITRDGLVVMMKEEDFDAVTDINLKGAFNMIRHCSGLFLRNREGVIINITSVSGMIGNAGQSNYSASKAGLIGLTKSVAKELASKGIRCNAVAPGFISTDMTDDQTENPLVRMIPLGSMGKPEDVADAVAFLATAGYITGEVLRVDGGIAM